jgi:hypothetical protein
MSLGAAEFVASTYASRLGGGLRGDGRAALSSTPAPQKHDTRRPIAHVLAITKNTNSGVDHHQKYESRGMSSTGFRNVAYAELRGGSARDANPHACLRPSYIFAIQSSPVTVITKNANAIPIFLFVSSSLPH